MLTPHNANASYAIFMAEIREDSPGARAIGVVFRPECLDEEALLRLVAGKHDNQPHCGDGGGREGAERDAPAERADADEDAQTIKIGGKERTGETERA